MKPHVRLPASVLFTAFALLPMVAGAQPAPVPLATSATVVSRDGGALPPGGITVTGRGSVSVPPDRLRVSVRLYPKNVTGQQLEKIAGDVAAAMRSGGIGDAKPVLPLSGMLGPNSTIAVVGTLLKPTRTSLESVLRSTLAAVPDATALALANNYQIATSYGVDDCSTAEDAAQSAAMADARARAGRVAKAAGVHLGAIVSVNESGTFSPQACGADLDDTNGGTQAFGDPYGAIAVPVSVNAVVVFAIR